MTNRFVALLFGSLVWFGAGTVSAQAFKVGDLVECNGATGKIVRTEPRAGWDEPFHIVAIRDAGMDFEFKCLPKTMRLVTAPIGQKLGTPTRMMSGQRNQAAASSPNATQQVNETTLCHPGAKLEAQWGISWYEVTALDPPDDRGACRVSFDGYGREWDTLIKPSQLRQRGGGQVTRPTNPIADVAPNGSANGTTAPDGDYRCHKISPGGQLMDIGDLEIRDGRATLPGLPDNWVIRSVSLRGQNERGQLVVAVDYRSSSGFNDRLDCLPQ